jgi:hypothetical protein
LELLDEEGNLLKNLTAGDGGSKGDGFLDDDTTRQHYVITLPDQQCSGCSVISYLLNNLLNLINVLQTNTADQRYNSIIIDFLCTKSAHWLP